MPKRKSEASSGHQEVQPEEAASGCLGVDAEPDPATKKARSRHWAFCLVCGCAASPDVWASTAIKVKVVVCVGPGCLCCKTTWVVGHFSLRTGCDTFEKFCLACESSADLKAEALQATNIRLKTSIADFFPSDVSKAVDAGVRISKKFTGYNKTSFEAKFKCTAESLGLRYQDIPDFKGTANFKGILVADSGVVQYEVFTEHSIAKRDWKLVSANHILQNTRRPSVEQPSINR